MVKNDLETYARDLSELIREGNRDKLGHNKFFSGLSFSYIKPRMGVSKAKLRKIINHSLDNGLIEERGEAYKRYLLTTLGRNLLEIVSPSTSYNPKQSPISDMELENYRPPEISNQTLVIQRSIRKKLEEDALRKFW